MIVYRLSDEAISELRFAVDEHTESRGTVRIAIDGGLKIKTGESVWTRPFDVTVEGSPDDLPLLAAADVTAQSLRALHRFAGSRGPGETVGKAVEMIGEAFAYGRDVTIVVHEPRKAS